MLGIHEATEQLTAEGQEHEVITEMVRGVATRVWRNAPPSLRSVLLDSRKHGANPFVVFYRDEERECLSYEEHYRLVAHLAQCLVHRFGIVPGDRVAIAMRNYPEFCVAFWAAAAAGAVVVPLNAWWNGRELHYGLSDSATSVLLCDDERIERIAPLLGELPALRGGLVCRLRGDAEPPNGFLR